MESTPLFVMTMARAGGTLLCHVLDAHPDAVVASDPYLPLLKALRNAIVQEAGIAEFDPASPFADHYFAPPRLAVLDAILAGTLDAPFDTGGWPALRVACAARAAAMCPDLVPHLDSLPGHDHRATLANALHLIRRVRGAGGAAPRIVGVKEVWTTILIPALARGFPTARFIVLVRDPRAIVASMLALSETDPTQRGHVPSYARHWRQQVALCDRFRTDHALASRLRVVRYEDLVARPRATAGELCRFLGLAPDDGMTAGSRLVDRITARQWTGNSSFERRQEGITREAVARWRETLDVETLHLVEHLCDPDMRGWGYAPVAGDLDAWADAGGLELALEAEHRAAASWRCGDDPPLEAARERARRGMVGGHDRAGATVREHFLFSEILERLRAAGPRDDHMRSDPCLRPPPTATTSPIDSASSSRSTGAACERAIVP